VQGLHLLGLGMCLRGPSRATATCLLALHDSMPAAPLPPPPKTHTHTHTRRPQVMWRELDALDAAVSAERAAREKLGGTKAH
jgi:hypothetical protein